MKISKTNRFALSSFFCGITAALLSTQALAHHPISAKFDSEEQVNIQGIVTKVDWRNPHAHVFVNVTNANGETSNWAIEIESPIMLNASGWNRESLVPGDAISVEGISARDGSRQIWGEEITLQGSSRNIYAISDTRPSQPISSRPAPTWPDGHVSLGATSTSMDGYWAFPSEYVLMEEGHEVSTNKYGLLDSIRDADEIAPFQPWALALFENRQKRQLQDDPMYLNCKPPGGPRQFQSDLGVKFLEDMEQDRVFVLFGSGNHNYRVIYMDGREALGQVSGDDDNPLYYGRSLAHWENDTFVVKATSFNEDFWLSHGGLPHTDQLELEERFTRTSLDVMEYTVTVNDLGAYTRPWTASWNLTWIGGEELPVHFCQENRP